MLDVQMSIPSLEDAALQLSSNEKVSSKNLLNNVRSMSENHRKLQRLIEADLERWLNVQDLVRAFELENHNLETSLMTVDAFLNQNTLYDWTSTGVNAKLNEIQVRVWFVIGSCEKIF